MNKFTKLLSSGILAVVATVAVPVSALAQLTYDYTYTNELTNDEAAGLFGGSLLCTCLVAVVGLLVQVGLAYWTYKDAKKRGNSNAALWAVLVFFFTLIALLVYILTQRKDSVAPAQPKQEPVQESPVTPTEESK